MDKIVRALELAEQSSVELAALRKRRSVVIAGSAGGGKTSFGSVSDGIAIVVFDGSPCGLVSAGVGAASGASPLIAAVSAGLLELDGERENARAAIIR